MEQKQQQIMRKVKMANIKSFLFKQCNTKFNKEKYYYLLLTLIVESFSGLWQ